MSTTSSTTLSQTPLAGIQVVECSHGVAAAYCGRLLATLGAEVTLLEPPDGHPLRREPPFLGDPGNGPQASALFAYLAAGKRSLVHEPGAGSGAVPDDLLRGAAMLVHDTPLAEAQVRGLDAATLERRFPDLVNVSVLPFGACGPKSDWLAQEINVMHAAGEGFLMPNGLAAELFPDRPPLKIHGHFAAMQAGVAAALGGLSALWAGKGQAVDVSVQDAALAVGCFAIQRLGDGSVEHRLERSFKYGGVLECRDGYVEVLTLEERQWRAMVELMDGPAWATDGTLDNQIERSRRGAEINGHIRAWARGHDVAELVSRAQALGVPMAPYNAPADVLADPHERARGLFQAVDVGGFGPAPMLVAPFHFGGAPLRLAGGPPALGDAADASAAATAPVRARAAR